MVSVAAGDDWLDSRRVARKRAAAAAGAAAKTAAAQEMLDKRTLETANPERAAALSVARSVNLPYMSWNTAWNQLTLRRACLCESCARSEQRCSSAQVHIGGL